MRFDTRSTSLETPAALREEAILETIREGARTLQDVMLRLPELPRSVVRDAVRSLQRRGRVELTADCRIFELSMNNPWASNV